jgi:D-alanine-D-alanine ligase-like ATP-grasp enzyme
MSKKASTPTFVGSILKKVAPKIGAKVLLESEWQVVGQITFKSGRKRYFRSSNLDINPAGAAAIAKDKAHANYFMKKMGYPSVPGETFFSDSWAATIGSSRKIDEAWRYAEKIGLPVIVKPNSGSRGQGVALVFTKQEFYRAMRGIFKHDDVSVVQKQVLGKDYRVLVLDRKVIAAYERIPLYIIGDGYSTIAQLFKKKIQMLQKLDSDTRIALEDPRIPIKLRQSKCTLNTVLGKNVHVHLLDNANLSSGGEAIDVTSEMHTGFKKFAVALTRDMGLRLCGVDIMVEGDITETPEKSAGYSILEINAFPGLTHYAQIGKHQATVVEDLYLEVLKKMEK